MSKVSSKIQAKVRREAKNRCGYCLLPQEILMGKLEIEHLLPIAEGGTDAEENLWLACRDCNSYKSSKVYAFDEETEQKVKLFNPRTQDWHEHFKFNENQTKIIGKTACGRATVITLRMNEDQAVRARMLWVVAGWYPPKD
ncbi:MAG TPA: HNH endonuclease signature motif containing protein [Pyrinomonadaceae bacterium]|nr:HNH endonuclease signature motif containing protein [Pyrinomonadaceae bacterium]